MGHAVKISMTFFPWSSDFALNLDNYLKCVNKDQCDLFSGFSDFDISSGQCDIRT